MTGVLAGGAAWLDAAVRLALAYLLGGVVGSLLIGRWVGGVDIRTVGSGNAGGTNALRTQGKLFALGVVLIDVLKGWLAARWLPTLPIAWPLLLGGAGLGGGAARGSALAAGWLASGCALAAILGHVYPIWYGFRGGKGAATLLGALAGLDPWLLAPVVLVWLGTVMLVGYVGLATMVAALATPVWLLATPVSIGEFAPRGPLLAFTVAAALLMVFTHRGNLRRMRAGTEPRAQRLWLGRGGRHRGGA